MKDVTVNLQHLEGRIKQLEDLKPALDQIGQDQVKSTLDNFQAGGRPSRWAPLAFESLQNAYRAGNSTRKDKKHTMKRAKGGGRALTAGFSRYAGGKKILIESGMLYGSIDYRSTKDISQTGVLAGSARAYAGVHQFGYPKKNIPARPFLVLLDEDRKKHDQTMLVHWRRV